MGTGLLFHQRWGRWNRPLCGKTLPRLEDFCEERVNLVESSKRLHPVTAAKAMIQWLTSNLFKARPRNGDLQPLSLLIEQSVPRIFLFLRRGLNNWTPARKTEFSVLTRERKLWRWCCSGALVGLELPWGASLYSNYFADTQEAGVLPQREEILLQL